MGEGRFPGAEPGKELLQQLRVEPHAGRGPAKEVRQLGVVLVSGLPAVGYPVVHE